MDQRQTRAAWRRSTRCSSGLCVEVAEAGPDILVRDSKQAGQGDVLAFGRPQWRDFVHGLTAGELVAA